MKQPSFNSALAAARTLGGTGYACFPCRPDKTPCTPNGYKAAVTSPEGIEELWSLYPGKYVGVATGRMSGVSVLDIDKKHPEAREWWAAHRERLLPARVHRTRSGGLHLLYRHREGLRNSAGQIARGIDVRGDGGYIVWWPAAGLPVLADAGIKPWPEWLAVEIPAPTPSIPPPLPVRGHDLRPTLHRTLGLVRTVALAAEGERNSVLFWAACRARDMVIGGELDHDSGVQTVDLLREAAVRAGLLQREIERTLASAFRSGAAA